MKQSAPLLDHGPFPGRRTEGGPLECDPAPVGPLRQGDVLRLEAKSENLGEFGIIVTSDCDIAHSKHSGIVSYVPVLTAESYLRRFVLDPKLSQYESRLSQEIVRVIHLAQQKYRPDYSEPFSPRRIMTWLTEDGVESAADTLGGRETREVQRLFALWGAYEDLRRSRRDVDAADLIQASASAAVALGDGKEYSAVEAKIRKQTSSKLDGLPGDALFLSSLTPVDTEGYVAYLRVVREADESRIDLGDAQDRRLYGRATSARRVSRLLPPYIYRLTQGVAFVFSSVGLPEEYEDARKNCANGLFGRSEIGT